MISTVRPEDIGRKGRCGEAEKQRLADRQTDSQADRQTYLQ